MPKVAGSKTHLIIRANHKPMYIRTSSGALLNYIPLVNLSKKKFLPPPFINPLSFMPISFPVRDLKVLPGCEFSASYAQPRWVKPYTGVRLVHESKVHSKDQTWFHNGKKSDRGNGVIEESVS